MRRLLLLPALAFLLVGTPVLALEQPDVPAATAGPAPVVTDVPLPAAQGTTVQAGFEQQVPVDASLVGVTWNGDPNASFTVETKSASGGWEPAKQVDAVDTGAEGKEAALASQHQATEPIWVKDATAVRVRLDDGSAADVKVSVVDSTPQTPQPTTPASAPATTAPGATAPPTTAAPSTTTSTTPPTTAATPPSSTPPAADGGQSAPPGSAGASVTGWLPRIDGPARYAFALALIAVALVLGAIALGWSPWRRGRSRRVLLVVALAALLLAACRPIPPSNNGGSNGSTQPSIILRSQWGAQAPRPACLEHTDFWFAVVHHTVNSNNYAPGDSAGMMRGIQAYHRNTLGYCDIAYHFIVDRYGQIFEGRYGGITNTIMGAHTGGFNTHSTGVALLGTYSGGSPVPAAQWNALVHLLQWKFSIHNQDVKSTLVTVSRGGGSRWAEGTQVSFPSRLLTHTDLWPTECPGSGVTSRMNELRDRVQAGIVKPPPTT